MSILCMLSLLNTWFCILIYRVSVCLGTVPQHSTAFGVISTPKLQFSPPRHFRDSHNAPCSQHDIWLQSQITQEETSQAADSNLEIFWGIWKECDLSKIGQTSRNRIQHLSFWFPLLSRLSKKPTIWIWILAGDWRIFLLMTNNFRIPVIFP